MNETERPNFNNENNQPIPEQQELKAKKQILTVEFDDGSSVEIPYTEKTVNFPEHLVKETGGVKGYVRKEVEWNDYNRVLGSVINIEDLKNFSLLDTQIRSYLFQGSAPGTSEGKEILEQNRRELETTNEINSVQSLRHFQRMISYAESVLYSGDYGSNIEVKAKFKNKLGEEKWKELSETMLKAGELLRKIIDTLGDNFMDKTNVHAMQGVWSLPQKEADEAFKQKMLLQSIFDPVEIEHIFKDPESRRDVWYNIYSVQSPSDTLNESVELPKTAKNANDYRMELKDKSIFLLADRGLSVSNNGFWSCDGREDDRLSSYCQRPFFGFGKENKAYVNYLKACLSVIESIKLKIPAYHSRYKNPQWERLNVYTESIRDILSRGHSSATGGESPHPMIPIIIGHPDIPELKWCHSSYAYIPTKNGMNVCKMLSE